MFSTVFQLMCLASISLDDTKDSCPIIWCDPSEHSLTHLEFQGQVKGIRSTTEARAQVTTATEGYSETPQSSADGRAGISAASWWVFLLSFSSWVE